MSHINDTAEEFAKRLDLQGLFILGSTEALSTLNHATGTNATVVGNPLYGAGGMYLEPGEYVDTGIAEEMRTSMFCVCGDGENTQPGVALCANYRASNGERVSGTYLDADDGKSGFMISGASLVNPSSDKEESHVTTNSPLSEKPSNTPISFFGHSGNALPWIFEPRDGQHERTAEREFFDNRVIQGTNFLIGPADASADSPLNFHMAIIDNKIWTDDQMTMMYEWAAQYLASRGIFI